MAEIKFDLTVLNTKTFLYHEISQKAKKLRNLGMNYSEIAKILKVNDKTVKKATLAHSQSMKGN